MRWMVSMMTGLLLLAPEANARSRYVRGRTLYHSRCGQCTSAGWRWSPTTPSKSEQLDLNKAARSWSAYRICTWQRRMARRAHRVRCRPGHLTRRDRLDILYYLSRRRQGRINKPRLVKIPMKPAGKIKLSRRVPMLKQRARKRLRWQQRRSRWQRGASRVMAPPPGKRGASRFRTPPLRIRARRATLRDPKRPARSRNLRETGR